MKILHTADWHIGKHLHKIDLSEDLGLFFNWLIDTIKSENIDVLIVAGDVFDQANPSQSSFKQYYNFLERMLPLDCKVIISGGNHDSAAVLNAPKQLLEAFDITVVGGAPEKMEELFTVVEKNNEKVVIASVPFLKDRDIRKSAPGESYSDKILQIKEGLKNYFKKVNDIYTNNYAELPFIIMAHLFVQGSHTSDSERDIQIGNQAGVESDVFGNESDYVALGHIHKPQTISKSRNIRYSGSPIPFSFSEKSDKKEVIIFNVDKQEIEVNSHEIPVFRNLLVFEGSFSEVEKMIRDYDNETILMSLGELIVNEENESIGIRQQLEELMGDETIEKIDLVKSRLNFSNKVRGASEDFESGTDVSEVKPMEMFEKKLDRETEMENKNDLKNAFREILEDLNL